MELAANRLLPLILEQRRKHLFESWQIAGYTEKREELWYALRELDALAGAINDAIREYGDSRES